MAGRSLRDFVEYFWPSVEAYPFESNWHIHCICDHIEAVFARQIRNILITVPPRHTKSRIKVQAVPWRWLHDPAERFLSTCYDGDLSRNDNVDSRTIINTAEYQRMIKSRYPNFNFQYDRNVKGRFANNYGGFSLATSVGGQLFGGGGSCRWIDDPHNYMDPDSEHAKEEKITWFERGMTTRVQDPRTYVTVIIAQRTAVNDLIGHILEKYGSGSGESEWVHLCLPSRYTGKNQIVSPLDWEDPRTEKNELLWPERFNEVEARKWEVSLQPEDRAAQLQQDPTYSGSAIVDVTKLQEVEVIQNPSVIQAVRFWDKAATSGGGNATAGVLILRYGDGRFIVADVVEGHWGLDEREEVIVDTAKRDWKAWGNVLQIGMEREPGSSGKTDASYTIRKLAGYNVTADLSTGSKDDRLAPFARQVRAENVAVLKNRPWTQRFKGACNRTLPGTVKDRDIPDASAGAFNCMTEVEMVGAG